MFTEDEQEMPPSPKKSPVVPKIGLPGMPPGGAAGLLAEMKVKRATMKGTSAAPASSLTRQHPPPPAASLTRQHTPPPRPQLPTSSKVSCRTCMLAQVS